MSHLCGDLPEAALSGDVAVFSTYLRDSGKDFLVIGDPGGAQARVRFVGRFQDAEVVWDCRFVTLCEQQRRLDAGRRVRPVQPSRNFIEIGPPGPTGIPLTVGLDIARIDHAEILKMIVMIRNYKRLKPGRHEFGASFPES